MNMKKYQNFLFEDFSVWLKIFNVFACFSNGMTNN